MLTDYDLFFQFLPSQIRTPQFPPGTVAVGSFFRYSLQMVLLSSKIRSESRCWNLAFFPRTCRRWKILFSESEPKVLSWRETKKNDSQNSNQSHKNMAVSQPVDGVKTTARELDLEQRAFLRNNHGRSITNDWFETFYYFSKLIRTGLVSLGWMSPTFLSNPSNHIVKYRSWLHCMSTMRVRWDVGSLFFVQERKKNP